MLLLRNQFDIKLHEEAPKVLKICPTVNNTFVMVVTLGPQEQQKLVHIDSKGKTLWSRAYSSSIDTFGLFNERQIIVLNVPKGLIQIIDLNTYQTRKQNHEFTFGDTSFMTIHTFYQTRFLCVEESGLIGQGKLVLTYYLYSAHSFEKISQYKSMEKEWAYGTMVAKANNHSKICWWKDEFKEEIQFYFWDLSQKATGALSTVKCRNSLSNLLGVQNLTLSIGQLWESQPNIYILCCNSNASITNAYHEFYVIDAINGIIRKAKFDLNEHQGSFVHFFNLGKFAVIHSTNFYQGHSENSPIYYIDNEKESVVAQHVWKASNRSHFDLPGSDPNLIIEAVHDNSDVKEIRLMTKRLMTISEIYMHLMLHLNQDFDDDLLQDALEMLVAQM